MSCQFCWCYSMQAQFTENSTTYYPSLFNSYTDAKPDFKCVAPHCMGGISDYAESLVTKGTMECYYRPGKENHAYLETGDGDAIRKKYMILFVLTIISTVFFLFVIIMVCICVIYNKNKTCKRNVKKIRINCKRMAVRMSNSVCFCCLTSNKKVSRFVDAVEKGDLYLVENFVRFQKSLVNSVVVYGNYITYPLLIACEKGNYSIAEYLLLKGARTSACEITLASNGLPHHKTALHFASEANNKPLIELLIRHGCLGYMEADKAHDLISVILLSSGDLKNLKLLIEAGYPIHKEAEAIYTKLRSIDDSDLRFFLFRELENPPSLQRSCRTLIRELLGHRKIQAKLNGLSVTCGGPLPYILVKYLKLDSVSYTNPCFPSTIDINI